MVHLAITRRGCSQSDDSDMMESNPWNSLSAGRAATVVSIALLADGVMAAQGSLKPLVMVRIHVGQPFSSFARGRISRPCCRSPGLVRRTAGFAEATTVFLLQSVGLDPSTVNKNPPCSGGLAFLRYSEEGLFGRDHSGGDNHQPEPTASYLTSSILVTANSPCSLSKVPVTLTFLVSLQISLWKPLETSPVSL